MIFRSKVFISSLIIICFFICSALKSQNIYTKKIIVIKDLAREYFESQTYNHKNSPIQILHSLSEDFIVDNKGNYYFVNSFSKVISSYNQKGELLYEFTISDEKINNEKIVMNNMSTTKASLYQAKLGTDHLNNLYILLLHSEYFYKMIKIDQQGELVKDFKIEKPFPGQRNTGLFISQDKIYVNTMPATVFDPNYTEEGTVFVYNLNGKFIGRADYYLEDNGGCIYTPLFNKGEFIFNKYKNEKNESLLKTVNLKKIGEIKIHYKKSDKFISIEDRWLFKGFDKYNNIFFYNESVIKKYDQSSNLIEEIPFALKDLKTDNILTNHKYIRIGQNGDIFVFGIKTNEQIDMQKKDYNSSDINSIVICLIKNK